jgi:hypothetical protein
LNPIKQDAEFGNGRKGRGGDMMPKTRLGMWAGVFMALFLVSLIALILEAHLLGSLPGSLPMRITGTLMMIAAIATFISGAVSLFKLKDRSFVVILATILGFFASLMAIIEVVEIASH